MAALLAVCPVDAHPVFGVAPDTRSAPFHDGANPIAICAVDFAGDETCQSQVVYVDNTPPALAFANANPNAKVFTLLYDTGERYFSVTPDAAALTGPTKSAHAHCGPGHHHQ